LRASAALRAVRGCWRLGVRRYRRCCEPPAAFVLPTNQRADWAFVLLEVSRPMTIETSQD